MRLQHVVRACAVAAALMVAVAGSAAAADAAVSSIDPPPDDAMIVWDAPLYPSSPDGWGRHFYGDCRPAGARYDSDPPPIDTLRPNQRVQLVCDFGSYALVEVKQQRTQTGVGTAGLGREP